MSGTLYLCATPIGNLEDITIRVLNTLRTADAIAAEDTRHTLKLLNHFEIKTPLISYHEHNKKKAGEAILRRLSAGENIALVSDAGMPGISDPGSDMVRLCHENDISVTVLPGASAGLLALVLSGMDSRRFIFEGFLPRDKKEKRQVLSLIKDEHRTMVFYEAPHHLKETLKELLEYLGDRKAACVREITKKFEELKADNISNLLSYYDENVPRGEFVIVIEGKSLIELSNDEKQKWESMPIDMHVQMYIEQGLKKMDAIKKAAKDRGVSKREIYSAFEEE